MDPQTAWTTEPGQVSEDEIRRAMRALEQAPRTETGILIPPHVAAEMRADASEPPTPNRAQRRWQKKQAQRAAKRRRS